MGEQVAAGLKKDFISDPSTKDSFVLGSLIKSFKRNLFSFLIRQPPALPCRLQHSTIGLLGLNHRVRDGYGCFPQAHRHRKACYQSLDN